MIAILDHEIRSLKSIAKINKTKLTKFRYNVNYKLTK